MKSVFGSLRRNGNFVKSVATLMTGRSLAFAIGFAFTPVIARLFEPADFGRASFFISVITVLGAASTLRFERAAVLPRNPLEGARLITLSMTVLAILCAALLAVGGGFWLADAPVPLADRLGAWVWALPLGLALLSLVNACEGWLVRVENYRIIAATDVGRAAVMGTFRVTAGATLGSSTWALITGYLLSFGMRAAVLLGATLRTMPSADAGEKPAASKRQLARQYRDFPLFNAPAGFVRSFADNLPIVMLGYLFSPEIVGFYAMANRIVRAPLGLAAGALRRVYLQRAASIRNEGRSVRGSLVKTSLVIAVIGIVPFGLLWLEGEALFRFVLGESWGGAGRYAEILAPWLYSTWVISAPTGLMVVLRRQPLWLRMQIGVTLARLAVFAVAYYIDASAEWAVQGFANVSLAANVIIMFAIFGIVTHSERDDRKKAAHDPEQSGE